MTSDRDQARAELVEWLQEFGWATFDANRAVAALQAAHPDLILRALGMKRKLTQEAYDEGRVWVEPPTDQGKNDG